MGSRECVVDVPSMVGEEFIGFWFDCGVGSEANRLERIVLGRWERVKDAYFAVSSMGSSRI